MVKLSLVADALTRIDARSWYPKLGNQRLELATWKWYMHLLQARIVQNHIACANLAWVCLKRVANKTK